ncbi:hypothetical protein LCGC14_0415730 [marine sediment metagenome]|uniref:Uncharacterized protein n=1 Tax=marine sediment metagenome TaxID=412755 RepID=A0A0F9TAD4_9ZZZZ
MEWKLIECEDVPCIIDNSGVYTVINRLIETEYGKGAGVTYKGIRVDIMSSADNPLVSIQGEANAVRKSVITWLILHAVMPVSTEHASYIGYEIMRARSEANYVQA